MKRLSASTTLSLALSFAMSLTVGACADAEDDHDDDGHDDHDHDDHGHDNETEVLTTVTLTLTPAGGGAPVTASFRDLDGDGSMSGTSDPLTLVAGTDYTLGVSFLNELENPPEDITEEIEKEAEEHQVFVYGSAVVGPATSNDPSAILLHAYADMESDYGPNAGDDLPVGLANTIGAQAAGTGELQIMLRHLPLLNGNDQKVAGLADLLARGEALPGDVDVDVTFTVTVQ